MGACLSYVTETLAGRAAVVRDRADDRRRLEAELADLRRSADELRQEAEGLRENGRLKDAFLATVAHELRTPLSAMLGWAHVLREEKVDEATSVRALDAILRNARAQMRLSRLVLAVARRHRTVDHPGDLRGRPWNHVGKRVQDRRSGVGEPSVGFGTTFAIVLPTALVRKGAA